MTPNASKLCACGCGQPLPPDRYLNRPRYIRFHYEASAEGKAAQSRGGRLSAKLRKARKA